MRPVTLTLDGFRSFASEIEIDWSGRRLVGIVGPIGSGKSTILDAICFGLYGKTPTEKSNQRSLINQRSDVGKVELVFDVDGERWKVVRAMRRKGQSPHALYRLDPEDTSADPIETVLGKGEVDTRIEEILGVDFDAFNRSVMLAQGRFAEFLSAGNTDRDKVLKGVFGLDKVDSMETIAKETRNAAKRDLEEFGRRKADLDNLKVLAARADDALSAASARQAALAAVAESVELADTSIRATTALIDVADQRTSELKTLAAKMPDAARSRKILDASSSASVALAEARQRQENLDEHLIAARQKRTELFERIGGEDELTRLRDGAARRTDLTERVQRENERLIEAQSRVTTAEGDLEKAQAAADAAISAAAEAGVGVGAAETTVKEAENRYHEAQHDDMAAALSAGLSVGDPCPVCAQSVAKLPKAPSQASELTKLSKALVAAQEHLANEVTREKGALAMAATQSALVESAAARRVSASNEVAPAEKVAAEATVNLKELDDRLQSALGDDPIVRLGEIEVGLKAASERATEIERQQAELKADMQRSAEAVEQAQAELRSLVSTVVGLASQLSLEFDEVAGAVETGELLASVRDAWIGAQQLATEQRSEAVTALAAATQSRAEAMESVGLEPSDDFRVAVANTSAAVVSAQSECDVRRELLASYATIDVEIAEKETTITLYDELVKDLRPSGFLGYLLEEERAELARVSSEQFEQLSGGRYRFSDDGAFNILDLNAAEQVRKASSLSGGETFLASLALALALAEMVARGSGRLDAFFLDEGFGSLDAEHLDLAMAGIESLVATHDHRLVVLVSHVPEMQERIEDLLVLDKDPATGASIVVGS